MTNFFVFGRTERSLTSDPIQQEEFYVTDGTNEGTTFIDFETDTFDRFQEVVIDGQFLFVPTGETGSYSSVDVSAFSGVYFNDKAYFSAQDVIPDGDSTRTEYGVAISDGTAEGTRFMLRFPGDDPNVTFPSEFELFGDMFFFVAYTPENGRELYVSDGTAEGTRILNEIVPGDGNSITTGAGIPAGVAWGPEAGGYQYFWVDRVSEGARLYRTDGTDEGTQDLIGSTPGYFNADNFQRRFLDLDVGNNIASTTALGDKVVFTAASGEQPNALYVTDGTDVSLITDFGPNGGIAIPSNFVEHEGLLYFVTNDTNDNSRTEIWRTDGTIGGTAIWTELGTDSSRASGMEYFKGHLYFRGFQADGGPDLGFELYRADIATGEISLFADTEAGEAGGSIRDITPIGDKLYFSANTEDFREPWVTDGTPEGTFMLRNISQVGGSADPNDGGYGFQQIGDLVYFVADADDSDDEVWVTDGTTAGTRLVYDFYEGGFGSDPIIIAPAAGPSKDERFAERATEATGSAPSDLSAIRDFDGNDLGRADQWKLIGAVDIQFDGDVEYIYINQGNARWATVGPDAIGAVNFGDHGQGGETRVVGIYIDPLVESGEVAQFSDFDSQQRFQNDLAIDNLTVIDAFDFDEDGFQEIYFKVNDGTAYLRALMHADGNIQYANYQNDQQVEDYLTGQGFGQEVLDTILI